MLGLPIVAATTARDSMWGPTIPELRAALGDLDIHGRRSTRGTTKPSSRRSGRRGRDHLILAGLSFEVCASLPAIAAQAYGYQAVVALDACGTFSHHKREAGLARLTALGIEVSDYATLMMEIMADNADPRRTTCMPSGLRLLPSPGAVTAGDVPPMVRARRR